MPFGPDVRSERESLLTPRRAWTVAAVAAVAVDGGLAPTPPHPGQDLVTAR